VPYYSNPLETHPIDEAISIANNKAFNVIQIADTRGVIVDPFSGSAVDAFSRLRTSEAFTLADYKHVYGLNTELLDELSNGGTVTHVPNSACVRLTTTSNTSSRSIHQSRMYHNYMPGKSQLVLSSFVFYAPTANVTKRTGYFDDRDGIFFEQDGGGVLSMNVRSYVTGSPVTMKIPQSAWNGDRCDGTGDSGWSIDITKTQLWWCDFQWLGVGRVRVGFVHEDSYVVAHTFYHSNILNTVYLSNPNLPIRCEIRNTGTTTGGYFDQICSTVISEGGYTESGVNFGANSGTTLRAVNTASGVVPIMAIRLKNTFQTYPNRVFVRAESLTMYASGNPVYWRLIKLPRLSSITLSSPTWTSVDSESFVEYNLTATAFTGGYEVTGGIVGTQSPGGSTKGTGAGTGSLGGPKRSFIAQNYSSTDSEIYLVCAQAIGGNATAVVDLTWREIS
jgi:hypothetical protein